MIFPVSHDITRGSSTLRSLAVHGITNGGRMRSFNVHRAVHLLILSLLSYDVHNGIITIDISLIMILYVDLIINHNFHGIVMTVIITMFMKITSMNLYNVIIIAPSLLSLPSPSVISLLLSLSYVLPLIISSGDLIPLILDTPQSNPWFSSGFLHI